MNVLNSTSVGIFKLAVRLSNGDVRDNTSADASQAIVESVVAELVFVFIASVPEVAEVSLLPGADEATVASIANDAYSTLTMQLLFRSMATTRHWTIAPILQQQQQQQQQQQHLQQQ